MPLPSMTQLGAQPSPPAAPSPGSAPAAFVGAALAAAALAGAILGQRSGKRRIPFASITQDGTQPSGVASAVGRLAASSTGCTGITCCAADDAAAPGGFALGVTVRRTEFGGRAAATFDGLEAALGRVSPAARA